jgi:hypothetical protein
MKRFRIANSELRIANNHKPSAISKFEIRNSKFEILPIIILSGLTLFGCSEPPNSNTKSNANSNTSLAAGSTGSAGAPRFYPKEPDPYSATMTINRPGQPPLQIEIAKRRGDRRWVLQLPGIGEANYFEKAGLKYLMLPARKQYAELPLDSFGLNGGDSLTPTAMVEKFGRANAEKIGKETVNGVMAIKYRVSGAGAGQAPDGGGGAENLVYIDEGSGLPVRIDTDLKSLNGLDGRTLVEVANIRLNPEESMFDIPTGTRKIGAEQLKTQMDSLIATLRSIAASMGQRIDAQPLPVIAERPANANTSRTIPRANGNRMGMGSR